MIFNHFPDKEIVLRARERLVEAMRTADKKMKATPDEPG